MDPRSLPQPIEGESLRVSRRASLMLFSAAAFGDVLPAGQAVAAPVATRGSLSPLDFGARFDGKSDDTEAWRQLVDAVTKSALPIQVPAGVSVISDTLLVPKDLSISGAGMRRTTLRIVRGASASLYGIRCASGLRMTDLSFELDNSPTGGDRQSHWVAALGFTQDAQTLMFERIGFRGHPARSGQWSGIVQSAAIDDVCFVDCDYRFLETAGVVKDNQDRSAQRRWHWIRCTGRQCTDGISINSPSGEWSHGSVEQCDFSECTQFPFSLAGPQCSDWTIDVSGRDNQLELLHIEDGATRLRATVSGTRCNLAPGVVGSPRAFNGMVQIIGGAHDITLTLHADIQSGARAVVMQAGGPRVSGLPEATPTDVVIAGSITLSPGAQCLAAFDTHVHFSELRVSNIDAGRATSPMLALSGCSWSGTITVHNPATLVFIDPNSFALGLWDRISLTSDLPGFPALRWAAGSFPEPRNAPPLARSLVLTATPLLADQIGWYDLCPAPMLFDGIMSRKQGGKVQAIESGPLHIVDDRISSAPTIRVTARGPVDHVLEPITANWRIVDGRLQYRAAPTTASPQGMMMVALEGVFFARPA